MPKTKAKPAAAKVYAVVGSDDVEVKHTAAELAEKLKPAEAGDFGLETIDGAADNADQAAARIRSTIEALRTLPFFGGEKVVWLKNANFLGDDQKARAAAVQAALEELAETINAGLGPEITFLLSAIEVDRRRHARDRQRIGKDRHLPWQRAPGECRSCSRAGAPHARWSHFRFEQRLGRARSQARARIGPAITRSRRERDRDLARRNPSDRPEPIARKRLNGTASLAAATRAFSIYFRDQSPARRCGRAFAAQKRRFNQRLHSRNRRAKCAPLFDRTVSRRNAGLSCRKSSTRHDAARSRTDFDRGRGEAARRSLTFADLFARDWADVRNIPARAGERFHRGNDPENYKANVNDRSDDGPKEYEDPANSRNGAKNRVHDR